MKFVAILSLAIIAAADNTGCTAYVCDPSGVTWGDNVCAMRDANATQIDLKSGECSSDQECPVMAIALGAATTTCATAGEPQPVATSYPGEKCDRLRTCIGTGVTCTTEGTCSIPATATTPCVNPQDCGLGQYCNNAQKCVAQVSVGGACILNTDCVNTAGCDSTGAGATGKCVSYSSVSAGTQVQSCTGTAAVLATHPLCASGYCYETATAGKFACAGAVSNSAALPNRCGNMPSTCTSTKDSTSTLTLTPGCECGYDGYPYCPLFASDPDMATYLSEMQSFMSSSFSGCNTARNVGSFVESNYFWCGQNLTSTQSYHAARATLYPQVIMATDCVVKIVNPAYYKMEGSESLLIGGLFLVLLQ